MSYKASDYGKMIDDKWRMEAYISAIKKSVKKGDVVIDLGAGTGIFSLIACKFGAKKVFAIESNKAVNTLSKAAKRNSFTEKIIIINKDSSEVELKEKADVIISDIRGTLPLYGNNLEIIRDARKRFLKRNGTLIPGSDQIFCSIVQSGMYADITGPWLGNSCNLDLRDAGTLCLNEMYKINNEKIRFLTDKKKWLEIDYYKNDKTGFKNSLDFRVTGKGTAQGIYVWFNSTLTSGVKLLNSPDVEGSRVYGRAFFPFSEAVDVKPGDRVKLDLSASLEVNSYIWTWKTAIYNKNARKPFKQFKQSSFLSSVPSPEEFLKKSPAYKTSLNARGAVDLEILNMFLKQYSIEKTANTIFRKYPDKFGSIEEALKFIGLMSTKYSS